MESNTKFESSMRRCDLLTRLLRTRPLLLAATLFLIGCILQFALSFPAGVLLTALALLSLAALCLRSKRTAAVFLILVLLPAGALRFKLAWNSTAPLPERADALLFGHITEEPEYNAETQRTICVLDDLTIDGQAQHGKLRLYLRGDPALLQGVHLGQQIETAAHVWCADGVTNPGQFNFSNYLRVRGLRGYATAEIEDASFSNSELRFRERFKKLRSDLGMRIDRLFPQNTAIARALILGDRGGLSDEERKNYAKAGVAHLLAISGMHMSILAGMLALLLGRFLHRSVAFGLTLAFLIAYGALIGFPPSLVRALLMYAILGFAPIVGRYSDAPTRLGAALLIHLLISPIAILDAGFVLSYAATAGILLLFPPLSQLPILRSVLDDRSIYARHSRRLVHWIAEIFVMTLAAQLAALPAVVHYFGAQPVWSLIANLVAAPLAMLGYILALLATMLNFAPLAWIADLLFSTLARLVTAIASLPLAQLRIARFPLWLVLLCAAIYIASSELTRLSRGIRRFLPFAVLLAIPVANLCSWCTTLGLSVVFLDAEQADCAVIRSEGRVYLIDAGDFYSPAADYLSAMNYAPEAIFLTHPHADHAGGLADILELNPPKRIYLSANWNHYEAAPELAEILDAARSMDIALIPISAGDEIELSTDVKLCVLSPKAGILADSANDDSLVLRMEYGDARALFLADASAKAASGLAGDIDLLKIAHHGACDGTDPALLAETSPSAAVISVGRSNSYGHPAPKVLEMLDAAGAQVFRTDRSGAITCRIHADGSLQLRAYMASEVDHGLE